MEFHKYIKKIETIIIEVIGEHIIKDKRYNNVKNFCIDSIHNYIGEPGELESIKDYFEEAKEILEEIYNFDPQDESNKAFDAGYLEALIVDASKR